jgi:hypothetical protein
LQACWPSKDLFYSIGFTPNPSDNTKNDVFDTILDVAEVEDLASLVKLDSTALQQANFEVVYRSIWGQFNFGPTAGTTGTPKLPGQLLKEGKYFKDIEILHGYNGLEGLLFFPPWIRTTNGLLSFLIDLYPTITDETLEAIKNLYPNPLGLYTVTGLIQRVSMLILLSVLDVS